MNALYLKIRARITRGALLSTIDSAKKTQISAAELCRRIESFSTKKHLKITREIIVAIQEGWSADDILKRFLNDFSEIVTETYKLNFNKKIKKVSDLYEMLNVIRTFRGCRNLTEDDFNLFVLHSILD